MSEMLFNLSVWYDKDAFPMANYSSLLCLLPSWYIKKNPNNHNQKKPKKPKTIKKFALVLQFHNTKSK